MKFPRLNIDTDLIILAADKDIKNQIGSPEKMKKLSKYSFLIQVRNDTQGQKHLAAKIIAGKQVIAETHKTMNTIKGTIVSEALSHNAEDEIQSALLSQCVTKVVERMEKILMMVSLSPHTDSF